MEQQRGIQVYESPDGRRRVSFILEASFEVDADGVLPESVTASVAVGEGYSSVPVSMLLTLGDVIAQIDGRVDIGLIPEDAYAPEEHRAAS
jgi:hypothetical protein